MVDLTPTKVEAKVSLKVIVDKVKKIVVYAEADHTFVDILFSFVTLPLGTIVRLLEKVDDKKFEGLGSLNNLYQSLKDFPECYLATEESKSMLLNPRSVSYGHCRNLKLKLDNTEPLKQFNCHCQSLLGNFNMTKCVKCGKLMNHEGRSTKFKVCDGGSVFVSDIATFIVTDDLCVMTFTFQNSVRLLTDVGITNQSCLEELQLDMDYEQMLFLLKMALTLDSSVLTNLVFKHTNSIRRSIVAGESYTFDQTDLTKKDESSSSKILLQTYLQKSTGRLLCTEVKEDFVDFLFGFLSIPIGTVIGELIKEPSLSCMNNILKSIRDMSVGRYLLSQGIKDMLLKPHIGQNFSSKNQLFNLKCNSLHHPESSRTVPKINNGGLLKESGMFIVTDDLIITPSSSFSTLKILNDLNVPFDDVETCEISIGLREGLRILNASLRSSTTLTDSLEIQRK